ncbi:MAG: hypothetical protein AAFR73_01255 [Pseudomonadota bacterium]
MPHAWGNGVAFDANVIGAPIADVQPTLTTSDTDKYVFDVAAVLNTLEAELPRGANGIGKFVKAMQKAITKRIGNPQGAQWLGPHMQAPPRRYGKDANAFRQTVEAMASSIPVAMGIADTSIAFVNRRFRTLDGSGKPTKTRFKFLWLQDRYFKSPPPGSSFGIFGTGTVLMEADINALIAKHWSGDALDEEAIYREFQSVRDFGRDLWSLSYGHGTSVLDLMAGADPGAPGSERPIYGIEFPTSVVADTSGGSFHGPMLAGLAAVSFLSSIISGGALVMNASISFVGGPHTDKRGSQRTHPTAAALKRLVDISRAGGRNVILTLPAGNHLQDKLFAEEKKVTWIVQPDDKTGSTFEIWNSGFDDFTSGTITLTPPGGQPTQLGQLPAIGTYAPFHDTAGREIARLYRVASPGVISDHLIFAIFPTQSFDPEQPLSPAGFWTFEIAPAGGGNCMFWSTRDDTLAGLPEAGRQARFWDEGYRKFTNQGGWDKTGKAPPHTGINRAGSGSVLAYGKPSGGAPDPVVTVIGDEGSRATSRTVYRLAGLEMDQTQHVYPPKHHNKPEPFAESTRALGGPMAAQRNGRAKIRWAGTSMASATEARLTADAISGVDTYVPSKSGNNYREF